MGRAAPPSRQAAEPPRSPRVAGAGVVYKARHLPSGRVVALKKVRFERSRWAGTLQGGELRPRAPSRTSDDGCAAARPRRCRALRRGGRSSRRMQASAARMQQLQAVACSTQQPPAPNLTHAPSLTPHPATHGAPFSNAQGGRSCHQHTRATYSAAMQAPKHSAPGGESSWGNLYAAPQWPLAPTKPPGPAAATKMLMDTVNPPMSTIA
jgi:hypothetical protein